MFDREVTITICANSADVREFWVLAFERFFGAVTITRGVGSFEGKREPNAQVSHLYSEQDPYSFDQREFDALVQDYKQAAQQECVLVVYRQVDGKLV